MARDEGSPSEQTAAGQKFGRFYLQELINSGGMADIWLATTPSSPKAFALRRMHDRYRFNFGARRRFVRGCELLSQIHDHENIIGYVEHGKTDGALYLVMEYVEGASLKQLYAAQDPVLGEHVAQILIDMAVALEHLHSNGYMHLDFKPENVLVTRNGSVRLIDFDIAQPLPERPKKMSKNPGTPSYMAPEQLQQVPIDWRVDVFAYGVSAYELLTNNKPFPGESPGEILSQQINRSDFILPRQHNPDIPLAMENVIVKCLEHDPEERYPFFSVLVRDLKSALYV
ncbi:MAG: serine/threonine protein kinase [Pedosphaera sp.]|nr:serine/threonine protein kinase [Pedosphaera sp.]